MENDTPRRMPNVPPFVKFVCANVPMVFDDSLSYYEALCALWKYVQGMTDVINNNATLEEEFIEKFNVLQGKFVELKNYVDTYFDNLDVQEEINHKLDEMAESGVLQEMIEAYLQPNITWTFDNVAGMKNSESMIDGTYARTCGYYAVNDGDGAIYKIREKGSDETADERFKVAIGDDLIAELIIGSEINVLQLGAKKDLSANATTIFQSAIDYSYSLNYQIPIRVPSGRYLLSPLNLRKNTHIIGEGIGDTYLKVANGTDSNFMSITESDAYNVRLELFTILGERDNNTCPNAIYIHRTGETRDPDENPATATCLWLNIDTLRITGIYGNGVGSSDSMNYMTEMRLNNINVNNCLGWGFYLVGSDNHYSQLTAWACKAGGFYVAGSTETFIDCKAFGCGKGLNLEVSHGWNVSGSGNNLIGCWAQENYGHGFYFKTISDCSLILKAGTNGLRSEDEASEKYSGVYFEPGQVNQRIDLSISATNGTNGHNTQAYGVSLGGVMASNIRLSAMSQATAQYDAPSTFVLEQGGQNNITVNGKRVSASIGSGQLQVNKSSSADLVLSGDDPNSGLKQVISKGSTGALRFDTWDGTTWKGRPFLMSYDNANSRFDFVIGDTSKTNKIGFFGSSGDTKKTLTNPVATDEASAVALINEVVTDLIAYGLLQHS